LKNIAARILLSSFLFNLFFPLYLFAAEPSSSSIKIISNIDGASLYLDGKDTGLVTPVSEPLAVEAGYHMIRVEKEGFTGWRKDLILTAGEQMEMEVVLLPLEVSEGQKKAFKNMDKKPINKRWWFWAIVLAAVGTAIANDDSTADGGAVVVGW